MVGCCDDDGMNVVPRKELGVVGVRFDLPAHVLAHDGLGALLAPDVHIAYRPNLDGVSLLLSMDKVFEVAHAHPTDADYPDSDGLIGAQQAPRLRGMRIARFDRVTGLRGGHGGSEDHCTLPRSSQKFAPIHRPTPYCFLSLRHQRSPWHYAMPDVSL